MFFQKKLYLLRINEGDLVNAFNTMISQLLFVDIKITEEENCISLFCSLLDSWDSLVVAIGSNNIALKSDDVAAFLLSEEMIQKNMEGSTHDALIVRGQLIEKGKGKSFGK